MAIWYIAVPMADIRKRKFEIHAGCLRVNHPFPVAPRAKNRFGFVPRMHALANRPDRPETTARIFARGCGSAGMI